MLLSGGRGGAGRDDISLIAMTTLVASSRLPVNEARLTRVRRLSRASRTSVSDVFQATTDASRRADGALAGRRDWWPHRSDISALPKQSFQGPRLHPTPGLHRPRIPMPGAPRRNRLGRRRPDQHRRRNLGLRPAQPTRQTRRLADPKTSSRRGFARRSRRPEAVSAALGAVHPGVIPASARPTPADTPAPLVGKCRRPMGR